MANRQKLLKVCVVALVMLVSNFAMAEELVRSREREAKQLNEPEQKYDLELSFPVDSDEATNVADGRRERIDQLIQEILSNEALAVNDTLPGTLLDPSSIVFSRSFRCESGEVVVDDQCVPCPPGTYFDEAEKNLHQMCNWILQSRICTEGLRTVPNYSGYRGSDRKPWSLIQFRLQGKMCSWKLLR